MDWGVILVLVGLLVMFAGVLWLLRSEDRDMWLDDDEPRIPLAPGRTCRLVLAGYREEHKRGAHLAARVYGCPMCDEER